MTQLAFRTHSFWSEIRETLLTAFQLRHGRLLLPWHRWLHCSRGSSCSSDLSLALREVFAIGGLLDFDFVLEMKDAANQTLETNRRPALALNDDGQFMSAAHAPACLSGGGRPALRYPETAYAEW